MGIEMIRLTDLMGRDVYVATSWVTHLTSPVQGEDPTGRAHCKVWLSDAFLLVREFQEEVFNRLEVKA